MRTRARGEDYSGGFPKVTQHDKPSLQRFCNGFQWADLIRVILLREALILSMGLSIGSSSPMVLPGTEPGISRRCCGVFSRGYLTCLNLLHRFEIHPNSLPCRNFLL